MLRNRPCHGAVGGFSSVPQPSDNTKRIPPRGPHEAALAPVLRSRGGDAVRRTRLRPELSRKARADGRPVRRGRRRGYRRAGDRKSTRLNSSHSQISYAVFCLKKKKKNTDTAIAISKGTARRSAHP